MAILTSAPSPITLMVGWEERFGPVLRRAAGEDGVITHAAIDRLARETNTDAEAADNAKAILEASGQASMRVEKMLKLIGLANIVGGEDAKGTSGRIALDRVDMLPENLQRDFLLLRGRLPDVKVIPPATLRELVTQQAHDAIDNGTARRISGVPAGIRGVRPIAEFVPHPDSNTSFNVYIVRNVVWISRASPDPSPLVGFWKIGPAPQR